MLLFIFVVVCLFDFCLFVVAVVCMFVCFVLVEGGGGNYDGIVNHTLLIVKVYFLKDDNVVLKMIIICSHFFLNKF